MQWTDDDPRRAELVRLIAGCGQESWVGLGGERRPTIVYVKTVA